MGHFVGFIGDPDRHLLLQGNHRQVTNMHFTTSKDPRTGKR